MMETSVIRREELIGMLKAMNQQLEKLELSMVSSISKHHDEWQINQEKRMERCGKQLDSLETKITSLEEQNNHHKPISLRLELSY
jgi:hypothetical protein